MYTPNFLNMAAPLDSSSSGSDGVRGGAGSAGGDQ